MSFTTRENYQKVNICGSELLGCGRLSQRLCGRKTSQTPPWKSFLVRLHLGNVDYQWRNCEKVNISDSEALGCGRLTQRLLLAGRKSSQTPPSKSFLVRLHLGNVDYHWRNCEKVNISSSEALGCGRLSQRLLRAGRKSAQMPPSKSFSVQLHLGNVDYRCGNESCRGSFCRHTKTFQIRSLKCSYHSIKIFSSQKLYQTCTNTLAQSRNTEWYLVIDVILHKYLKLYSNLYSINLKSG